MITRILFAAIIALSVLPCFTCQGATPDTLHFTFKLHRQTRRAEMTFHEQGDSLVVNWQMPRYGKLLGGSYAMGKQSAINGNKLCLNQPEPGSRIELAKNETAFMISAAAYEAMKQTGVLEYNGTRYIVTDSLPCGDSTPSIHVTDPASGSEMWIIDSPHWSVVWKVQNSPLEIGWEIENAASAFNGCL